MAGLGGRPGLQVGQGQAGWESPCLLCPSQEEQDTVAEEIVLLDKYDVQVGGGVSLTIRRGEPNGKLVVLMVLGCGCANVAVAPEEGLHVLYRRLELEE